MLIDHDLNKILNLQVHDSSSEVLVFSAEFTSRLSYTLDFVFKQMGLKYQFTCDEVLFLQSENPKINYSEKHFQKAINLLPSGFLLQRGISPLKPDSKIVNDLIFLFPDNSDLQFDIFSAVFFMISRYEEWQDYKKDTHGRFEIKQSFLFQCNFHLKPVTDIWINLLKDKLLSAWPQMIFTERKFQTISTLDIDNLFAYKNKGVLRTGGGFAKDALKGDMSNLKRRLNVLKNKASDPFDIYADVSAFCETNSIPLICFFLMATGTAYDRTVDPSSGAFSEVFQTLLQHHSVIGIHPSYYSERDDLLKKEKGDIEKRIKSDVVFSRQHYLRFDIRNTPAYLTANGITHDFSMGFASAPGFRAGTAFPFFYFDFNKETAGGLYFVPFCAMDGAFMVYENLSAAEAMESMLALKEEIRNVNGFFITVFHERTFDNRIAPGFGEMFKELMLK